MSGSTLDELIAAAERLTIANDQSLTLHRDDLAAVELGQALFDELLQTTTLRLDVCARQRSDVGLTLTGTADLLGFQRLGTTILITQRDQRAHVEITGVFPVREPVELFGFFTITGVKLCTAISEPDNLIDFAFVADLLVPDDPAKARVPIELKRVTGDVWRLGTTRKADGDVTLAQVAKLLGGHAVGQFVPAEVLRALDTVSLEGLAAEIDTKTSAVHEVSVGLAATGHTWRISDRITLSGLRFGLTAVDPGGSDPVLIGILLGTFALGGTEVHAFVRAATTGWAIGLDPARSGPTVNLADVLDVADGNRDLPSALTSLPNVNVSRLVVEFTPAQGRLDRLTVAAATISDATEWEIVPGFLKVRDLAFELDLTHTATQWSLHGEIRVIVQVGADTWLAFGVSREAGTWTVSGGLAPGHSLSLTDMTRYLLNGHVQVPSDFPEITLSSLSISGVPGHEIACTGSITTTLTVGPVELTSATLNFGYDTDFHGSISGELTVAGASIVVTATIAGQGAWSFEAHADTIEIGEVIDHLATTYEIDAIPKDVLNHLRLKNLTVKAGTRELKFLCEGEFAIAGKEVNAHVDITVTKNPDGERKATFDGTLSIDGHQLTATFQQDRLTATWRSTGLKLTQIARALGFDPTDIPDAVDFELKELTLVWDIGKSTVSLSAATKNGKAAFAAMPLGDGHCYVFGVHLPLGISLADPPLIGDKLPDGMKRFGIPELGCWVFSDDLTADQVRSLRELLPEAKLPDAALGAGPMFAGPLVLGADTVDLRLPAATKTAGTPAKTDATKWYAVDRTFGVLSFRRIGIRYADSVLVFLLDASIQLGPLTITADGLGVETTVQSFEPKFHLDGMALAYSEPPLEISGGFLVVQPGDLEYRYDGFAVAKADDFMLAAVGSYGVTHTGEASLFVFAQVGAPLGGPPACYVTGLMAGFGYNRSITVPEPDQVLRFPLLSLDNAPKNTDQRQAAGMLARLEEGRWIVPKTGEHWLAAGIRFTSFELVDTDALLIAQFGERLAFTLLGVSRMRLPKDGKECYASVELQLRAVLLPSSGFLGVTALLGGSSYVISPDCKIAGGFAFCLWFGGSEHAGQFVLTVGGYHPAFTPPRHFPTVPRLALNWAVSQAVTIKGEAYFALTTSCAMAGGSLEITYRADNVHAWFTARMDVLVAWEPFRFTADIDVSMGVSYTAKAWFVSKTFTVSLGASVRMWGPPTGGVVTVDLRIIKFVVEFGSAAGGQASQALDRAQFRALLPTAGPCTLAVSDGLVRAVDVDGVSTWLVRAVGFAFRAESAIPVTTFVHGDTRQTGFTLDLRPRNVTATQCTCIVTVYNVTGDKAVDLVAWEPEQLKRDVADSLWGKPLKDTKGAFTQLPQRPEANVVKDAPVGVAFTAPKPLPGNAFEPDPTERVPVTAPTELPLSDQRTDHFTPQRTATTLADIAAGQAMIPGTLREAGLYTGPAADLRVLRDNADVLFSDVPLRYEDS